MNLSLDSLVNQLLPVKAFENPTLLNAIKAGVLDAVVLSSTELTKPTKTEPQFRLSIKVGQQQYQIDSKVALPVGARVQLAMAQQNLGVILKVLDTTLPGTAAKSPGPSPLAANAATTNSSPAQTQLLAAKVLLSTGKATVDSTPVTDSRNSSPAIGKLTPASQPVIEQALRQALPQQQPLRLLLPLLLQLSTRLTSQAEPTLPKGLSEGISKLLQQFPRAEKLQSPQPLRKAVQNNGTFLETKLLQATASKSTDRPVSTESRQANPAVQSDVKGLIQQLIGKIEQATGSKITPQGAPTQRSTSAGETLNPETITPLIDKALSATASRGQKPVAAKVMEQSLDILLRQLGRQLLAALARTQLNQLDSLAGRQLNSVDPQGPANSWVIEIPILHGKHVDNLELRIEQDEEADRGTEEHETEKLWTVMLAFDLHALGKLNVQLKISGKTVAATVWSQLQSTHQEVKQHIRSLHQGLEKVGVSVKRVDCQLGLPPKSEAPLYRQLVDVRT